MQYLWDSSEKYIDSKDNKERRMIFDIAIKDSKLHSEDINMFEKLTSGGFDVWLDTTITCNHIGPKKFIGDFSKWVSKKPTLIDPTVNTHKQKRQL